MSSNIFRFITILLGAPGSGKGTISDRLKKDFDFSYISTGNLLRTVSRENTSTGKIVKDYINTGELVPDDLVHKLVERELNYYCKINSNNLLIDGYPRNLEQAENLEKNYKVNLVIDLDIPRDEILNRLKDRWIHRPSGRIYNMHFNPPKRNGYDDITGEALVQREDDNYSTVRSRIADYESQICLLRQFYKLKRPNVLSTFKGTMSNEIWPRIHVKVSEYIKANQYTEYK